MAKAIGPVRGYLIQAWSAAEWVAGYAMVGGIPAYLEWLDFERSLSDNIRDIVLSPG